MSPKPITPRQMKLYKVLEAYIREHGYSPSYAEVMEMTGYKSKSTVSRLVHHLAERGWITYEPNKAHGIGLVDLPYEMRRTCPTCKQIILQRYNPAATP